MTIKIFFERISQCYFYDFKHIIFDDNYPPDEGDCYSFKKKYFQTQEFQDLFTINGN